MNNKRLAPHVQIALARHQPAKPTTAQPRAVTTPRPQPQPAPTVPQRQQQTPGGLPTPVGSTVHGVSPVQAKLRPAAPRLNHPTVIQRMQDDKERRKQRKAKNAGKYSVDQQKQLERQVVKSGVTTNKVAETISKGVSKLSIQDTSKIGHGLGNSTSSTRGGNEQAVGGFFDSLSTAVTNTNESDAPQTKRNTNFSKKVDIEQVVENREKKKTDKKQQQQQSASHQEEHKGDKDHISATSQPQKPFARYIGGTLHKYEKCAQCNKYWVPVVDN